MENIFLIFLVSFLLSLILTPVAKKVAYQVGAVDHPNQRKVHNGAMARFGGLAIILSFLITSLLFLELSRQYQIVLLGAVIIVAIGIIDDIKGVKAKYKLVGQIVATIPLLAYNLQIDFISHPVTGLLFTGALAIPITILWVVGLVNAVNMIDGLDGLAGGVIVISALAIAIISFGQGNVVSSALAVILAGATLGFLKYNFNPAEIFMGDTGSMFLGYMLASISLVATAKSATAVTVLVPVIALGVPIFDTSFAVVRRLINGKHPFRPDKEHLHHRFLSFGLNQKQTVLTIYLVTLIFGVSAVLLAKYESSMILLVVASILLVLFMWLKEFGIIRLYPTKAEPIDLLQEIKVNLIKLSDMMEDELELARLHNEIGQLEELIDKVPEFVYAGVNEEVAASKGEVTYRSLRERVLWLVEIIDLVLDNYQTDSDNLNYIFQDEKYSLVSIYDSLSSNLVKE
ncbi:undecaprenyl/decaprenyl-phosphate alpha-N-acetylglucosaminyl 1-phosphate transferase [Natroniella acetigena]|uniref:glycosyltransferase family 4 protein n=1 Tax=Natroniella acetigena TaxID=52004 RepID=UPI00200B6DFE|nr:MraY family glycosyltransferase [Natroniella acetigena]MCK8827680.1 undecaprenyl/decaprenyl-phosphate alpha-N-acetylglucosaminyl 1-phosphate transferase [Natroniella acetigena]